ncbi:MAG TPA: TonB-dependent receptor [Allosphingosinicella sp.]|uniref:TonB-dependent receptor n=1 Tax=Allosphingosinicella sp. TaxID=2823234 RepID=UPI002ED7B0C3
MRIVSLLCASTALVMPAMAFAQSTGSVDFEEDEAIVVTGSRVSDVGGVTAPDTTKAKAALTSEVIARQNPGQTILDTINLIPGVSFQNNDAYGSSGGTLNIRGFSADRVSLTVDGIPLNDSGNYAIYSNQQFDPEIIGEVSVNLGTTDVDSPTASAAGGTVNYRTIVPREELGAMVSASVGEYNFRRIFGLIETGNLTSFGTRAFISASSSKNDNPFNNYGKVNKQQYNAKLYQPIGNAGDFVSIAGHYNQNRNNFFGSLPLRWDEGRIVGGQSTNRFPRNNDEREYIINYPCSLDTPQAGVVDSQAPAPAAPTAGASCGTEFDRRYNPSNTGNIRGSARITSGAFTFTVDPSYQYVKANGGGTVLGREGVRTIGGANYTGFIGGQYYFGRDLNGDGDTLDTCSTTGAACSSGNTNGVTLLAPSQTQTHRYGVIAGVRWDINDDHAVRAGYTWDRARHRQTGEVGAVLSNGEPADVFPVNDPISDASGTVVQKRDRLSYAILHQIWGEYRGEFLDEKLVVNAGLRVPFFKRDLNNYCFTTASNGNVDCFGTNAQANTGYAALNPTLQGPQQRVFKYDAILPNIGFIYDFAPRMSVFANYAKGLSVPSTDNLYNSFFFAPNTPEAQPNPEKTDNYDVGVRYRGSRLQAQLGAFYNRYTDRSASAFDPELNTSVFRNLGRVDKYGLDGYVAYQPMRALDLYVFGSYLKSEIKDDLLIGETATGDPIYAPTAGKRESGAATYTLGGTVRGTLGPVELGVTGKRTGPRYIFDTNQPILALVNGATTELFPAKAPAYWLVNLDARYSLKDLGLERTYVQFNVYNLFDQFYVGGFGGGLNQSLTRNAAGTITGYGSPPFVQIGAPRTISGTLVIGF